MILQAVEELSIDVARSVLVGDKESDIEAGRRAGVGTTILLKSARYAGAATRADHMVVNTLNEIPSLFMSTFFDDHRTNNSYATTL